MLSGGRVAPCVTWLLLTLYVVVHAGPAYEEVPPIFKSAADYRFGFQPITPPGNPVTIRSALTPFNLTVMQMRLVTLPSCTMISSHIHPRGTELGYVITGVITFGMFLEDASRQVVDVAAGQGVVVPQGTVHYAANHGCTEANIVVIFDHPNPQVVYVGEALSGYDADVLKSMFKSSFPAFSGRQTKLTKKACKC